MNQLRQALASGLVLGAAWGALEALVLRMGPWVRLWGRLGEPPPLDPTDLVATLVLGAAHYGVLAALGCAVAVLVLGRLGRTDDALLAPRLVVGTALFANLYWHTKQLWAFSWGLPFTHWKRLLLTAAWVVVAALGARLLVRRDGALGVPRPLTALIVTVLLAAGGSWAMAREATLTAGPVGAPADAPNVLYVVVDALRADRLGCYGHERDPAVSPNVDRLAAEGVVHEVTWAQAPFTWTSFGSFLTGKYPREHGLIKMWPDQMLDVHGNRTLAQALQQEGWATGAFLTGTLSNDTGLLHGFDTYFETIVGHEAVNRHSKWSVVRSRMLLWILYNKTRQAMDPRLVNTEALRWIRDQADRPWFALVHYYSTHTPYDPPPPYDTLYDPDYSGYFHPFRQKHGQWIMQQQQAGACQHDGQRCWSCEHFDPVRDVHHVDALYDGGVRFADEMFGSLLDLLEELDVADDTLVVFTSDHGEELYDHGLFEHDWMFETNLQVPLVIRYPGREHAGARVLWPVEMRDIPATVLDVAGAGTLDAGPGGGAGVRGRGPGRSLRPDAAGVDPGRDERHVFAENVRYVSVRNDRWKLTQNRFAPVQLVEGSHTTRLFDLATDPGEHRPVPPGDPVVRQAFRDLATRFTRYDEAMPLVEPSGGGDEAELVRRANALAQLGYMGDIGEEARQAAIAGSEEVLELLGNSQFLGSNELQEEAIYERPFQWPPGFNGRAPDARVGARGARDAAPRDDAPEDR